MGQMSKAKLSDLLHKAATRGGDDEGVALDYLVRRGSGWQFRMRVPGHVRQALGKREFVRSLGQVSYADAKRKWAIEVAKASDAISEAERMIAGRDKLSVLTANEISVVARRYFALLEEKAEAAIVPFDEAQRDDLAEVNDDELIGLSINGIGDSSLQHVAKAAARMSGIEVQATGPQFTALCEAVHAALVEHHLRQKDRLELRAPIARDNRFSGAPPLLASNSPKLGDLVDRWANERGKSGKTLGKMRAIVDGFKALNGDMAVDQVTGDHVQALKEHLLSNGNALTTAANKLGMFKTLIGFAIENRLITQNPCVGISIKPGRARTRRAFEVGDLHRIFSSPVFAEGARPVGGAGEAAYWLPLIALFTGAREREIGQLRSVDIVEEAYQVDDDNTSKAWVFRLIDDPEAGLKLKNKSSERRIPVHPALVARGFIQFVEAAKAEGRERLFPDLSPDRFGNPVANWSKWFGRYLRNTCGITDKRQVFHSFRHTFKHFARQSGIAPDVQNEITGHETGDVADRYGGLSYPLRPLVEGMCKFSIIGFVLPAAPVGIT